MKKATRKKRSPTLTLRVGVLETEMDRMRAQLHTFREEIREFSILLNQTLHGQAEEQAHMLAIIEVNTETLRRVSAQLENLRCQRVDCGFGVKSGDHSGPDI